MNGGVIFWKHKNYELDGTLTRINFDQKINLDFDEAENSFNECDIPYFEEINKEKFQQKIQVEKERVAKEIQDELQKLQRKFNELYKENKMQTELKKLTYDEFCIDYAQQDQIKEKTEEKIQKIYTKTERMILQNELIFEKIKNATYDQMNTHLKTITGLEKKVLVLNFQIPSKVQEEKNILRKVKFLRRMEQKEKDWLLEEDPSNDTFFNFKEFIDDDCDFVINARSEKPELVLVDFEAREQAIKEYIEEQRKRKENENNDKNALRSNKQKFEIKNRRQRKTKRMKGGNQMNNDNRQIHKKLSGNINENDEENEELEWSFLYSQVEVFSRFKKINQIYFIRNLITLIKREFNSKFEHLQKFREKKLEQIAENNKKMEEIYLELKQEPEYFSPLTNIIEKVENLLRLKPEEITFTKYQTQFEREKIQAEKEREQARLQAINTDDSNVRALKMMMNNTLEEKKENILQKEIEKEEWMDKPREEMTEEEKVKFNNFLEKQEQLKIEAEKLTKILNQELKKMKVSVKELIQEFDHKASILFMTKFEYMYRVYEQELIILKIKKNLYRDRLYENELGLADEEILLMDSKIKSKQILSQQIHQKMDQLEQRKNERENDHAKLDSKLMKQMWQFLLPSQDEAKRKKEINQDFIQKICEMKNLENNSYLNPYLDSDQLYLLKKYEFEEQLHTNSVREFLKKKGDMELVQNETIKFFNYVQSRVSLNELVKKLRKLEEILETQDKEINDQQLQKIELEKFVNEKKIEFEESKTDLFLMLRLPTEKIEIQTQKVIPLLNDIILIDKEEVEVLNREIKALGDDKVQNLRKNLEEKQKVEADLIELQILKKEIKEALVESAILTRLKVSKRLQAALYKKDENLIETEEKYAKKQIEKLLQSTDKVLQQIQKKEKNMKKEIKTLNQENDNLLLQGGSLQDSVSQRKEIFTMIFNKNPEDIFQEDYKDKKKRGEYKKDEVGFQKAKDLAKNRKLFDVAKKLAHEIEDLMLQLKTIKDRTYPNLGNQLIQQNQFICCNLNFPLNLIVKINNQKCLFKMNQKSPSIQQTYGRRKNQRYFMIIFKIKEIRYAKVFKNSY